MVAKELSGNGVMDLVRGGGEGCELSVGFLRLPTNDADTMDVPVSSKRDKHLAESGASGGEDDKLPTVPRRYMQKLVHEIVRRPGVDDELGGLIVAHGVRHGLHVLPWHTHVLLP